MGSNRTAVGKGVPCRLAGLVVLGLGACSSLTPQMNWPFASESVPGQGTEAVPCRPSGPASQAHEALGATICQVEALQNAYIVANQDQSNINARTGAMVIATSALALFKGVTGPHPKDLAGLGVLGSGAFAYGSSMTSRARQSLYLAGAQALECGLSTARAYQLPADWLGSRSGPTQSPTFYGELGAAQGALAGLRYARIQLAPSLRESSVEIPNPQTRPETCKPSDYREPEAGARTAGETLSKLREIQRERARRHKLRCEAPQTLTQTRTPHPEARSLDAELLAEQTALASLISQAERLGAQVQGAAGALRAQALGVYVKVAGEQLKAEPDLAAVRAAASSLRQSAQGLTGASVFAPPPAPAKDKGVKGGVLHSDLADPPPSLSRVADPPGPFLVHLSQTQLAQAVTARLPLQARVLELQQRLEGAVLPSEFCAQRIGAQVMGVEPPDAALTVPQGGSKEFQVSSPGFPSGEVVPLAGGAKRALPLAQASSSGTALRFKLVYSAPAEAVVGSQERLTLSDGGGLVKHDVLITITAKQP